MSKLVDESSIPILLEEMSLEEKIRLLIGGSAFSSAEIEKYNIPSVRYLDGATGVNLMQYICEFAQIRMMKSAKEQAEEEKESKKPKEDDTKSSNESGASFMQLVRIITSNEEELEKLDEKTRAMVYELRECINNIRPEGEEPGCFPPGMLLGATWNPDIIYKVGEAVAREAMAYGIDVLLGTPNTNIHRDPKNGRLFESFSEDPHLSSHMAPAFSRGVQDQGVLADVKHFAANNQETLRQGIDEHISERALREIYLPGFEAAVKEGNVETVMSAYNSINGVPCAQNKWLLTTVLKEEWGFKGQVVSDWGAVYDQVEGLNAGNDLDMPGPRGINKLVEAFEEGAVSLERLNDAVTKMLNIVLKSPKFKGKKYTVIDTELSRKAAYDAAIEGITLLKNNGVLPLRENTKVSFFGNLTERFMESGSGSAQVDTSKFTSLPKEAARYTKMIQMDSIKEDTEVVIITAGASGQEGKDRPSMDFDDDDKKMLYESINKAKALGKKIVVLMNVAGPVELLEIIDDIDALVCLFFPGMEGARAVADILFGRTSPSGKLPLTFPKTYRDCPSSINFPGEFGHVNYGEGIFVGYRYYDYKNIEPLYPFGFGLTYSAFSITDIRVSDSTYNNDSDKPLVVTLAVQNTGEMAAKEVIQLYVRDIVSTLLKPEKELRAFKKVCLEPGEKQIVELMLYPRSFASYDTNMGVWTMEPGEYELLIGNSSRNIFASTKITLTGSNPYGCSIKSSIAFIAGNKKACAICKEVLGESLNIEHLKSQAIYFGSTSVDAYLKKFIKGYDGSLDKWKELLKNLDLQLSEVEI